MSSISTLRNVADVGTKALSQERILCLLYMLCVVDCADSFRRVGADEFHELESRISLKQQVRRLQHSVTQPVQHDVMLQALRIAVVLNELNCVNALGHVSPMSDWSWWIRVVVAMVFCVSCAILVQGCSLPEQEVQFALYELWMYRAVEWIVEHPRVSSGMIILMIILPRVIILLLWSCRESRVKVILEGTVSTVVSDVQETPMPEPSEQASPQGESDSARFASAACEMTRRRGVPGASDPSSSSSSSVPRDSSLVGDTLPTQGEPSSTACAKARTKPKARSLVRPDVPHQAEVRVYVTCRRGLAYRAKRGCKGLNSADEIVRIGVPQTLRRGFVPCRLCYRSQRTGV